MSNLLVIFSHGKESGPWGAKIQTLAKVAERLGAQVMSLDYREYPPGVFHDQDAAGETERRVDQLVATPLLDHRQLVLVGSSMGRYVSAVASERLPVDGLFLMAPAFYLPGYANQDPMPHARTTMVVHGWSDNVVPVDNSIQFARLHRCDLYVLDGDHRLNEALSKIESLFESFLQGLESPRDS